MICIYIDIILCFACCCPLDDHAFKLSAFLFSINGQQDIKQTKVTDEERLK